MRQQPVSSMDPPTASGTDTISSAIAATRPTTPDLLASPEGSGTASEIKRGLRLVDRLVRFRSHHTFLTTCRSRKITPRGLQINFPLSGLPDTTIRDRIQSLLHQTEAAILDLCASHYGSRSKALHHELQDYKSAIKNHVSSTVHDEIMAKIHHKQKSLSSTCEARKKKKLAELSKRKLAAKKNRTTTRTPTDAPPNSVCRKRNRRFKRRISSQPEPSQVINLSSVPLTSDQQHVLSLGPKFCPTPGSVNEVELLDDVLEGARRLRLREFFYDENSPAQLPARPKFYKKTFWKPPEGRDRALDAYCSTMESMVKAHNPHPPKKRNISKNQRTAIATLRKLVEQREIRISPADKGGAVVVQDFSDYEEEALRQLNNENNYVRLSEDPTVTIAEKSNSIVENLKSEDIIDENCRRWATIQSDQVRTHTFYHLPKIHKDRVNPPGRPIVSGVGGPTENLSKLVDHWLQPLVHSLPSFIKDTTHFLHIVEEWKQTLCPLPPGALIVTIDVVGLYANIPHDEVEISLRQAVTNNRHLIPEALPADRVIDIVNHVLHNNVFEFDGRIFRQIFGTAMGTPMAPTIANIFMGWLEDALISKSPWPINTGLWRRFIDDIVMLWLHGEDQLQQFLEWLNLQHPTIKFTANHGTSNVPYLDVSLSIVDGDLLTDLHVKDTDAHMYLPFSSCHPRHCVRSIPYSQCLRIRRICSDNTVFHQRCEELKAKLVRRGYPTSLVDSAVIRVANTPRSQALIYNPTKKTTERVPFVITHNPSNPPLSRWLKDFMPIMHTSARMTKAVTQPPIVGERRCGNLRKALMPSRVPRPPTAMTDVGCRRCTRKCIVCKSHLQDTLTFASVVTGEVFHIRDSLSCSSTNIIYLIDCRKCRKQQYVGETGNSLQTRFYNHRSDIRTAKATLVARHFRSADHGLQDMQCTAIEQIHVMNTTVRKAREKFWRHKLRTNYPDGLNVFD